MLPARSIRSTPLLRIRPSLSIRPGISVPQTHPYSPSPSSSLRCLSFQSRPTTPVSRRIPSSVTGVSRRFASLNSSSGKSEGDLLVEELQELYEVAKDEFEIATDSTDGATIYAASDRESARDALNQFVAVYSLYTTDIAPARESHGAQQQQQNDGEGQLITTNYEPSEISPEVREEVKRRVRQRVRELQTAVEALEERAKAD
ncbi:hypothetical protein ASPWEDRAFT_168735 [Aspergillus wentii DTO 134E9]|uniref:Uncharacterized protein n=1 Tax=Aspergillus wentii DTO 134E9 TaxID=1073089 RepID=A0A1L9RVH3_ASPWE|nr:uncharacterized protein ASPWEDRAFT_168735 [Aspergillus wentii DTO 134E9]OJJ38857.1 hypothetical protein ASPWEDRAFT_168735 [Aspergillus wentii DTO 134E9]